MFFPVSSGLFLCADQEVPVQRRRLSPEIAIPCEVWAAAGCSLRVPMGLEAAAAVGHTFQRQDVVELPPACVLLFRTEPPARLRKTDEFMFWSL